MPASAPGRSSTAAGTSGAPSSRRRCALGWRPRSQFLRDHRVRARRDAARLLAEQRRGDARQSDRRRFRPRPVDRRAAAVPLAGHGPLPLQCGLAARALVAGCGIQRRLRRRRRSRHPRPPWWVNEPGSWLGEAARPEQRRDRDDGHDGHAVRPPRASSSSRAAAPTSSSSTTASRRSRARHGIRLDAVPVRPRPVAGSPSRRSRNSVVGARPAPRRSVRRLFAARRSSWPPGRPWRTRSEPAGSAEPSQRALLTAFAVLLGSTRRAPARARRLAAACASSDDPRGDRGGNSVGRRASGRRECVRRGGRVLERVGAVDDGRASRHGRNRDLQAFVGLRRGSRPLRAPSRPPSRVEKGSLDALRAAKWGSRLARDRRPTSRPTEAR